MDVQVENHGSIVILSPVSDAALEWCDENIGQDNGYQPYWPNVVVEPRYVSDILEGMANDGLSFA